MIMQYGRSMTYLNQLKNTMSPLPWHSRTSGLGNISPLVIEQQVIGVQYNKLMRFYSKQEFKIVATCRLLVLLRIVFKINGYLKH